MIKILIGVVIVFACVMIAVYSGFGRDGSSPTANGRLSDKKERKITADEAKARMDAGGVTVVDVRTQEEYDEGHVEGAVLIPNETIGDERPKALLDLDAEILVYCRSGARSSQAAAKLTTLGYTNVWDFGGIIDWNYGTVS